LFDDNRCRFGSSFAGPGCSSGSGPSSLAPLVRCLRAISGEKGKLPSLRFARDGEYNYLDHRDTRAAGRTRETVSGHQAHGNSGGTDGSLRCRRERSQSLTANGEMRWQQQRRCRAVGPNRGAAVAAGFYQASIGIRRGGGGVPAALAAGRRRASESSRVDAAAVDTARCRWRQRWRARRGTCWWSSWHMVQPGCAGAARTGTKWTKEIPELLGRRDPEQLHSDDQGEGVAALFIGARREFHPADDHDGRTWPREARLPAQAPCVALPGAMMGDLA